MVAFVIIFSLLKLFSIIYFISDVFFIYEVFAEAAVGLRKLYGGGKILYLIC